LDSSDATGRYPVHVASKWGATPDVIHFLIQTNPIAAGIRDDLGKTPMHYIAEYYSKNYSPRMALIHPMEESMLQCVRLLKASAPKSMNLEDNEGCNAIEYALENEVDIKIIKAMQRACRDDWRERSSENAAQHGRRRHADLIMDVERMACELQKEMSNRHMHVQYADDMDSWNDSSGSKNSTAKTSDTSRRIHFHRSTPKSISYVAKSA
jgi:hypothetical protein